ncbi:hypothetical protein AAHA92_05470 [Salvia divinorum]|uniref:DUF3343 domain-containing protein n=1 Tax=Salvia divinorum TaxID=28513 RepID=A0ABD1I3Q1_SALDI
MICITQVQFFRIHLHSALRGYGVDFVIRHSIISPTAENGCLLCIQSSDTAAAKAEKVLTDIKKNLIPTRISIWINNRLSRQRRNA